MIDKKGYNLVCNSCVELFRIREAEHIYVGERVEGGRCWRCLVMDSPSNPVYVLGENVK